MGACISRSKNRSRSSLGDGRTPVEAFDPLLREETLVINDQFMRRWANANNDTLYLPKKTELKVPIRKIVIEAKRSLVSKIKRLVLNGNPVTTIDGKMNIEGLDGFNCGFEEFPSWIKEQEKLESLYLHENKISEIPAWLHNLPNLKTLFLHDNKLLQTIPSPNPNWFQLNISDCDIRSLPRDLFHYGLEYVDVSDNKELTFLPVIPPSSRLRELKAHNCSIKSIHPSIVRPSLNLRLDNNQIEELPQKEMLDFLQQRGDINRLNNNPLIYPPKHVFDEGKDAIINYLTTYANSMINAEEITIVIIGRQEAGKTSLGLCFAGKIASAIEIKLEDRTQVFDVYLAYLNGIRVKVIDLGGHKEYESALAVLCRDHGLHICLLNPDDFKDDESLYERAWIWVEKILDGADSPHFLFVVSKIDLIDESVRQSRIDELESQLLAFLDSRMGKPLEIRKERAQRMKQKLTEIEADIAAVREGNFEELAKLEEQKRDLERRLSNQVHKVKNPPVFNTDCVSFVSSYSREGFDTFESNLQKAISNLPKVMLHESWKEASDWLLSQNQDKPYVKLDDLRAFATSLTNYDVTEMLKALNVRGNIIWHVSSLVIFHKIEKLAIVMKSLFYHEMPGLLGNLADFLSLQPNDKEILLKKYRDGQLPHSLIKCMFAHLHKELKGSAEGLRIGFDDMDLNPNDPESEMLMESLLTILCHMNIITLMDQKILGMKMYFIPHLVFEKVDGMDTQTFIGINTATYSSFNLTVLFTCDSKICKKTFAKSCSVTTSVMQRLASIIGDQLVLHTREDAYVARAGHFDVAIYKPESQSNNHLKLMVKLKDDSILQDVAWIVLNDISSNIDLIDDECQLVCPMGDPECEHGDYDPQPTFHGDALEDDSGKKRKRMKKLKCDPKFCFPSQFAIKIMDVFHPRHGHCQSPLLIEQNVHGEALANFLETSVILSVIAKQPVEKESIEVSLEHLPAFCRNNRDKFSNFVRPVRQYFDNIGKCTHKEGCKGKCFLLSETYNRSFALLEQNSAIVTKGEWTAPMKLILDKYPGNSQECTGVPCSVTAMVRTARNMVAHEDGDVLDDKFWSEIRSTFEWFIMHCFACRVHLLLSTNVSLLAFANAFLEMEAKAFNDDKSLKPSQPLLRVNVQKLDGTKKDSTFYFDMAEQQKKNPKKSNEVEFLRLKVVDVFQLSPHFQGKIVYNGVEEAACPDEVPLTSPTHITDLHLDTRLTHLFHISEWEIMVQIETFEQTIENTFCSSDQFLKVEKFVRDTVKDPELWLFDGKAKVNAQVSIGSVFKNESCELKALNPKDPAQRAKLFV